MTGDMGTRKASWGMAKRATAFILSFVMAFNTIPTQALADDVAAGKQNEAIEQTEEQVPGTQAVLDEQPSEGVTDAEPAQGDQGVVDQGGDASPPAEEQAGEQTNPEETLAAAQDQPSATESTSYPAFSGESELDGVVVRVTAEEGTFPADARLSVRRVSAAEKKAVSDAVAEAEDTNVAVTSEQYFDIKVIDANNNELQPANGHEAIVQFASNEVKKSDDVTIYHIEQTESGQVSAEPLETRDRGEVATTQTDSFSIYVLKATYGGGTYELRPDVGILVSRLRDEIVGTTSGTLQLAQYNGNGVFSVHAGADRTSRIVTQQSSIGSTATIFAEENADPSKTGTIVFSYSYATYTINL